MECPACGGEMVYRQFVDDSGAYYMWVCTRCGHTIR